MENIIKQAKSDIFKEMYSIINFYIKKGAKPDKLKKYYKNKKRFNDLLEDIRNKGVNLVKDEKEYQKIVRETLNDMLDDFIAKDKDEKSKLKHIKEFNSFNEGLFNKNKDGDDVVLRILDIIKKENIKIKHTGGYQVEIDDRIYSFSEYRSFGIPLTHDCVLSIFDIKNRITSGNYSGVITGDPISKYNFSYKYWKKLENIYKEQQKPDIKGDLKEFDPVNRDSKKYNI